MSDLEFTRIRSNNETDNQSMKVWLWDLGPEKPVPPVRPKPPVGKEDDPEHGLALIDFREAIEAYDAALRAYKTAKAEYEDFATRFGGPYEREFWSVDARVALERDKDRWCISSRTRGYGHLKNGGLPKGVVPGHGQAEQERRMKEGEADLEVLRRKDPVFGEEARS